MAKTTHTYEYSLDEVQEALQKHFHIAGEPDVEVFMKLPITTSPGDSDGPGHPQCVSVVFTVKEK